MRQSQSVSLGHSDLLISPDRTPFSVCPRRLASEGWLLRRPAISARSCLPEHSNFKFTFTSVDCELLLTGERRSQLLAYALRGGMLNLIKSTKSGKETYYIFNARGWRGMQFDVLTCQKQDNLHKKYLPKDAERLRVQCCKIHGSLVSTVVRVYPGGWIE